MARRRDACSIGRHPPALSRAVPRAKRAPTPVTNWTEAYAECRARQKSATACVPLLDLCRKYQRVHHALLVAPPLRFMLLLLPQLALLHALLLALFDASLNVALPLLQLGPPV